MRSREDLFNKQIERCLRGSFETSASNDVPEIAVESARVLSVRFGSAPKGVMARNRAPGPRISIELFVRAETTPVSKEESEGRASPSSPRESRQIVLGRAVQAQSSRPSEPRCRHRHAGLRHRGQVEGRVPLGALPSPKNPSIAHPRPSGDADRSNMCLCHTTSDEGIDVSFSRHSLSVPVVLTSRQSPGYDRLIV